MNSVSANPSTDRVDTTRLLIDDLPPTDKTSIWLRVRSLLGFVLLGLLVWDLDILQLRHRWHVELCRKPPKQSRIKLPDDIDEHRLAVGRNHEYYQPDDRVVLQLEQDINPLFALSHADEIEVMDTVAQCAELPRYDRPGHCSGDAALESLGRYHFVARTMIYDFSTMLARADMSTARRRLALLALALEQHRLERGEYPASLEELAWPSGQDKTICNRPWSVGVML